jgi:hypothetical protein
VTGTPPPWLRQAGVKTWSRIASAFAVRLLASAGDFGAAAELAAPCAPGFFSRFGRAGDTAPLSTACMWAIRRPAASSKLRSSRRNWSKRQPSGVRTACPR